MSNIENKTMDTFVKGLAATTLLGGALLLSSMATIGTSFILRQSSENPKVKQICDYVANVPAYYGFIAGAGLFGSSMLIGYGLRDIGRLD